MDQSIQVAIDHYEKNFGSRFLSPDSKERTTAFVSFLAGWEFREKELEKIIGAADFEKHLPALSFQRLGWVSCGLHDPAEISYSPTIHWTPLIVAFSFYGYVLDLGNLDRFSKGYWDGFEQDENSKEDTLSYAYNVGYDRGEMAAKGILPLYSTDPGKREIPSVKIEKETKEVTVSSEDNPFDRITNLPQYRLAHSLLDETMLSKKLGGSNDLVKIMVESIAAVVSTISQESK